jgi:hypothetical protein
MVKMKGLSRTTALFASLLMALTLSAVGCKGNQNASNQPSSADQSQQAASQQAADQSQPDPNDPANANVVPISNTTTGTASGSAATSAAPSSSGTAAAPSSSEPAAAPSSSGSAGAASSEPAQTGGAENAQLSTAQYNEDNGYGQQPETYAPQPPPELPQYQQPPAPGEGYIWTPGNWRYAQTGYFWVPGAWVHAPYQGALWTPGYWGWRGGRYAYYRGYWGRHVGFYGGINYGFGYVGFGYHGGYWRGNDFFYNREVNNINVRVVRNVYEYKVVNITNTRVSFNGGHGGVQYRPRQVELVATVREQHNPPMQAQVQIRMSAERDRQNFAEVNHGRPAMVVVDHPVQADRNVRPPAPVNYREQPMRAIQQQPDREHPGRPMIEQHPAQAHPGQPNRAEPNRQLQGGQHGPNKQMEHGQPNHPAGPQHPQPNHEAGPQHPQPNHPGAAHPQAEHGQPGHANDQKKNDQKKNDHKKPEDQHPQ